MTANHATKQAARRYAQQHGVNYRDALAAVRRRGSDAERTDEFARRVLIEAIEGCGIGHWAQIGAWDGAAAAVITDIGGECSRLSPTVIRSALLDYLSDHPDCHLVDVDSYLADEIVQTALFGGVIYRFEARPRPNTFHA